MRIKLFYLSFLLLLVSFFSQSVAYAADKGTRFVTTTSVLADFLKQVAGENIKVHVVASPKRDLHKVVPTPKDVLKTKKADVFIHHGLSAEPWLQPLLNAAGNRKFLGQGHSIIDASKGIHVLEVPHETSRIEGDIHPGGNPHYWMDPENAVISAEAIARALGELFPEQASHYQANLEKFRSEILERLEAWKEELLPYKGMTIVTYHRSWSYFAERFDLKVVGEVEPKPGIPITAKHLSSLLETMKSEQVDIVIQQPFFDERAAKKIARQTNVAVLQLWQMPGGNKSQKSYVEMMSENVKLLSRAFAS